MSSYEHDMAEIARIQFHSTYPQWKKNEMIMKIEQRMSEQEQLELDGKTTGYYN